MRAIDPATIARARGAILQACGPTVREVIGLLLDDPTEPLVAQLERETFELLFARLGDLPLPDGAIPQRELLLRALEIALGKVGPDD